jgi:preprotein translocase subunit SecB|tara:strand:+ start:381 stop:803 length:423 start_codon:yes stop_codon:yes gene_type:complete
MIKKYKILSKFIKDISSETADLETYLFVKDRISKYKLGIEINSKVLKKKVVEIHTVLKFEDKEDVKKKSYFEIDFVTIVKVDDEVEDKKELEKILLCDVQVEISKYIEQTFLNILHDSGYPGFDFEKKLDFEKLYNQRSN